MKNETNCEITINKRETILNWLEYKSSRLSKGKLREITKEIKIPEKPGVYVFVQKKTGKKLYIGQSENIHRRILQQHLYDGDRRSSSSFRKKLKKDKNLEYNQTYKWIQKNCYLKFITTTTPDEAKFLEAYCILKWRFETRSGGLLYNS